MARRKAWLGWSSRRRPLRTSRSSTNPSNRSHILPGRFRIQPRSATITSAPRARDGPISTHLRHSQKRRHSRGHTTYRASKLDCDVRKLKAQCCPNALARRIPRDLHEDARDVARAHAATPQFVEACRRRKKSRCCSPISSESLRLTRLRLRGPNGARDEFLLAATAQNLRRSPA